MAMQEIVCYLLTDETGSNGQSTLVHGIRLSGFNGHPN